MKIVLILMLTLGCPLAHAGLKLPSTNVATFDEALAARAKRGFTGSVLVKKAGSTLFQKSVGLRDLNNPIAGDIENSDRFLIGSNTKQFVAASILMLEERGLLSVDDLLSKWIPEYPLADKITLKQLLNHTSGVPNYTDLVAIDELLINPVSKDYISNIFFGRPLDFEPGTKWNYSNSGYFLLGIVMERSSGKDWFTFVKNNILVPLDMKDTGYDLEYVPYNGLMGFDWDRHFNLVPTKTKFLTWADAAGGIYSTTDDIAKWNRALHHDGILNHESYLKMISPGLEDYGFGIIHGHVPFDDKRIEVIGHSGGLPGFYSKNYFYPEMDLEVTVLSNNTSGEDRPLEGDLLAISMGEKSYVTQIPDELKVDHEDLKSLESDYSFVDFKSTAHIVMENGELFFSMDDEKEGVYLKPVAKDVFYLRFDDILIEFKRDESGQVTSFVLTQRGRNFEAKK